MPRTSLISRIAGIDLLLQRMDASDRRTEERFDRQDQTYKEFRGETTETLVGILAQQKIANGRTTKLEAAIGITDDRAAQLAKQKDEKLPLKQGLVIAGVSVTGTGLVGVLIAHLAG